MGVLCRSAAGVRPAVPRAQFAVACPTALTQAVAKLGGPPRNPDVAIEIDILDISARTGGNIRPGLFVQASGR